MMYKITEISVAPQRKIQYNKFYEITQHNTQILKKELNKKGQYGFLQVKSVTK